MQIEEMEEQECLSQNAESDFEKHEKGRFYVS